MTLNTRSLSKLDGVHPDLVRVILRAAGIYKGQFIITEGVRALEKQKQLKAIGASTTMRSRHLVESNACKMACAVDLTVWLDDGDGVSEAGEIRWDWPLYEGLAVAVKEAAQAEGVPIEWGGDWATFKDGPHFQLPWSEYP